MTILAREIVDIYRPVDETLSDLDDVPCAVQLVQASVPCNIHRGVELDQPDTAYTLGVDYTIGGYAYFNLCSFDNLADRYILRDADGIAWLIRNSPAKRGRFAATSHVRCLVLALQVKPNGLP